MPELAPPDFDTHCREAVGRLRAALLDLYRSAKADPTQPQDVARRFKLNKNLTWRAAKIIQANDAFEAAALIPGTSGMGILVDGFAAAGAPSDAVDRARKAADEIERMIEIHVGDRATLELVLDSMGGDKPLERSRKLAFRGNSGIHGIQVHTRVTTHFMAANRDDPGMLDMALIGGVTRVRKLRPGPIGPVFQVMGYDDAGEAVASPNRHPIENGVDDGSGDPWLLRSFCEGALPPIRAVPIAHGRSYEFGDNPVGKTSEFTCFFGFIDFTLYPRFRDEQNHHGELISTVALPAETLLFDAIVHRDLAEALAPEVMLYGRLWESIVSGARVAPLPCAAKVIDLGRGAPVATPLVANYPEIVAAVESRCGWDHADFHVLRLVMDYPPMPSTTVLRFPLIERA
ncbi:MAG: hypothetical protein H6810_04185 [Phycisphaeraceae bacterium]|nr:MAG: hypothetical protein H6810_04185 [Phycisphaeraceae bacterium]